MEPTPKKRGGLFNFTTSLFRGSSAPAAETERNASFESPAKRASDNQLAARKLSRPQGPSSKLSQSMSASDFSRAPSAPAKTNTYSLTSTPRRMPGDNPHKVQSNSFTSSTSTFSTPQNPYKPNNFSGSSTAPRNLFKASMYNRAGMSTFSPRVSANPNQSFPPMTPGKASRGAVSDIDKRALANTSSAELFNMRIPSPPRELTGEVLAKEVPEGLNRSGSIYADEFLAHYCPPDLDEQQRRQFFCILDLRRLKYAADEVFAKKDWKINILNFAKEYEKSRSLIMLRYGLYEFKTVRASEAVKKEWKQKHGIASSDDESESTSISKPNGAKRKAEEQLVPGDNALGSSSNGVNKRARAPDVPAPTPKRKASAVGSPDENQPAKLFKSAPTPRKTPSATKSVFESIVNNTNSATPAKSTFGASVFQSAAKAPAASENIFGHLSDNSKGSGNDVADEDSGDETSTNADEDESEAQGSGQSEQSPAGSGSVATPQFGFKPTTSTNGTSSASSETGEPSQAGRSLFDRITRGADGQPVRKVPAQDGPQLLPASDKSRSVSPVKEQPAAPSNNTWNTGTPIKFSSATTNGSFGSAAPKPAASSTVDFAAKSAEPAKEASKAAPAPNLFASLSKKEETPAASSAPADKPAASGSLFNLGNKATETANKTPSLFQNTGAAPATSTTSFGSASSLFGQAKTGDEAKPSAAPSSTQNLFGSQPTAPAAEAPKSVLQSSTLFGKPSDDTEKPAEAEQPAKKRAFGGGDDKPAASLFAFPSSTQTSTAKPLFGAPSTESKPEPSKSLFGSTPAQTEAPKSLFGNAPAQSEAPKSLFGGATTQSDAKPLFGGAATQPEMKPLFGGAPAQTEAPKPLFGSTPAQASKPLFGSAPAQAEAPKPLFGATAAQSEAPKPLFGAATAQTEAPKPLFGAAAPQTEAPKSLFGSTPAQAEAPKPLFGATPAQNETPKPAFGGFGTTSSSAPLFGGAAAQSEAPKPLFGNVAAPASPAPAAFSFGASQNPPAPTQQTSTQSTTAGSIFGNVASSFSFTTPSADGASFNNPFASGTNSAPGSFDFGSGGNGGGSQFVFGGSTAPTISFSGASDTSSQPGGMFSFGASQAPSAAPVFGAGLAPGGGTSTGTNTPFTFGGASSLATTPATGTPEPAAAAAEPEESRGTNADGDDAPQEQISLTEGGPGEEDEAVVYEVRAKAMKFETEEDEKKKQKSPWVTKGVGPLRLMKHKTTGAVRLLLRAEPRGHIALNKAILPNATYKTEQGGKYIKLLAAADDGKGLETWMLQVKTADMGKALAEALETNKKANEKPKEDK
ncbi:hypothetical protein V8F20_009299 [Naviculisporaceae sp. PSN 640]